MKRCVGSKGYCDERRCVNIYYFILFFNIFFYYLIFFFL